MDTSVIQEEDIRNATEIKCYGGYHAHADFHVWMKDGRLLRLYSKQQRGPADRSYVGYHVALQGVVLKILHRGDPDKDDSVALHRMAYEAYGRRRGI